MKPSNHEYRVNRRPLRSEAALLLRYVGYILPFAGIASGGWRLPQAKPCQRVPRARCLLDSYRTPSGPSCVLGSTYGRGIFPLLRYVSALPYGDLNRGTLYSAPGTESSRQPAQQYSYVNHYRTAGSIKSYLISADGALDSRVLEMLRSLDDGEKLRELVPLPALPRVAVQGHLLLETQGNTKRE